MALSPVLNKEQERKTSKLDRAAQLAGMTGSLASAAGSAYGMFNAPGAAGAGVGVMPDDTWLKALSKLRLTNKGLD